MVEQAHLSGFQHIELPIFEDTALFARGVGESTDVVSKEMYTFADRGDRSVTLRPEGTAGVMRSVIEHNLDRGQLPVKAAYAGPFFRYERPQEGRYREFTQADVDVVGDGALPFRYDVELALVIVDALSALPLPAFRMRANNRKLSEGFYRGIGLTDTAGVLRSIDKLDKIGPEAVGNLLREELGATEEQVGKALALAEITAEDLSFVDRVRALGVQDPLLEEGLAELAEVIGQAAKRAPGQVTADLSIARGLDYYTGTVYETVLVGHEELGSICSGGRYESLASDGKRTFPGVGLSIGVTRLVARILSQHLAAASRKVPTAVYVALTDEDTWSAAQDVAQQLRARGIPTEVSAQAAKFGKQIRHADRRGIPYVWFTGSDEQGNPTHEVKDIRSGEQHGADPADWTPPAEDLLPQVARAQD